MRLALRSLLPLAALASACESKPPERIEAQISPPDTRKLAPPPTPIVPRLWAQPNPPASELAEAMATRDPEDAALLERLSALPTGVWLGEWTANPKKDVAAVITAAKREQAVAVFVPYNIPSRDCGQHSSGGAKNATAYRSWIAEVAAGIGSGAAIVVLEPDSLTVTDCLTPAELEDRMTLLRETAASFAALPGVRLYLDGGHPGALPAEESAERLRLAGVGHARGFALNVSNFESTARNIRYGETISGLLSGKSYVIDTSRNGNGANREWCNPFGRALGEEPSLTTGLEHGDAFLWVKRPGESDGTCNGGPAAGQFWPGYALELARAAWQPALGAVAEGEGTAP